MGRRADPPRRVTTAGALALAAARPRRMDRQPRISPTLRRSLRHARDYAGRIAFAIASYERTLYSDRTPFDAVVSSIGGETPAEKRGREVFFEARCHKCHTGSVTSDQSFRNTGLRPLEEDRGRTEVTGLVSESGRFRTPSLRNVGQHAPYMHNGSFATLEEVVKFYDRGGDFDDNKDFGFIRKLGLTAEEKSDLVTFLKNEFTDPRVEAESGPLFDRPMLYSESAQVPEIVGTGTAGARGVIPQVVAIEPPFAEQPQLYGRVVRRTARRPSGVGDR